MKLELQIGEVLVFLENPNKIFFFIMDTDLHLDTYFQPINAI